LWAFLQLNDEEKEQDRQLIIWILDEKNNNYKRYAYRIAWKRQSIEIANWKKTMKY